MSRLSSRCRAAVVFACLALLCLLSVQASAAPPRIHVLLVAVTGYNHKDTTLQDAPDLDTVPDVEALQSVLETHLQIPAADITVLQAPAETTHAAIKAAFYKYLVNAVQPGAGDVVYFHYSGHGSQAKDPRDPSQWDQTLVPSDYLPSSAANDISNHEINGWLRDLAARKPGNVLLTFDCCHSGVITRGALTPVREYVRATRALASDQSAGGAATAPGPGDVTGLLASGDALGYTVISACRNDQVDAETTGDKTTGPDGEMMGSLSYALARAFGEAGSQTTYSDLMQRVTTLMQEKGVDQQEPQMEGSLDSVLFSAAVVHPQPAITVDVDSLGNPTLMAGTLMGIAPKTKIAIYAHGTHVFAAAPPIATGVVDVTNPTTSTLNVTFNPGHTLQDLHDARALVTARYYTDAPLTVSVSGLTSQADRAAATAALAPLVAENMVKMADAGAAPDLRILNPPTDAENNGRPLSAEMGAGAAGVAVQRQDGSFLTFPNPTDQPGQNAFVQALSLSDTQWTDTAAQGIRRESRRRLLNALPAQNAGGPYQIAIRVIPCEVGPKTDPVTNQTVTLWLRDDALPSSGGTLSLPLNAHFRIELRNMGQATAYVTLLDIQEDGAISPVWPEEQGTTYCALDANSGWMPINNLQTHAYKTWRVTEPLGNETLLALATQDKTDFSPLLDPDPTRGLDARDAGSPLSALLRAAALGTRSAPDDQPIGDWGAFPYSLTVMPSAK